MRLNIGSATTADRNIILSQPSGTWTIHNNVVFLGDCKWCGDMNGHDYIKGACWKCWRSRHHGALE
jgi:hypothetical protein